MNNKICIRQKDFDNLLNLSLKNCSQNRKIIHKEKDIIHRIHSFDNIPDKSSLILSITQKDFIDIKLFFDIHSYIFKINWGDGVILQNKDSTSSLDPENFSHKYNKPGNYTIIVDGYFSSIKTDNSVSIIQLPETCSKCEDSINNCQTDCLLFQPCTFINYVIKLGIIWKNYNIITFQYITTKILISGRKFQDLINDTKFNNDVINGANSYEDIEYNEDNYTIKNLGSWYYNIIFNPNIIVDEENTISLNKTFFIIYILSSFIPKNLISELNITQDYFKCMDDNILSKNSPREINSKLDIKYQIINCILKCSDDNIIKNSTMSCEKCPDDTYTTDQINCQPCPLGNIGKYIIDKNSKISCKNYYGGSCQKQCCAQQLVFCDIMCAGINWFGCITQCMEDRGCEY
jgi:hypothetical protein